MLPLQPSGVASGTRATVMLRPELVSVYPETFDAGVPGTVVSSVFFGRDQRLDVQLASGDHVVARCGTEMDFAPGDTVRVSVERPLHLMPIPESEPASQPG